VVFKLGVVEIFAAGRAVEIVLAVRIQLPDPLVVQVERTEQRLAPVRLDTATSIVESPVPHGSTATHLVATRTTRRALWSRPNPARTILLMAFRC
jgi:hypothetical protein